MTPHPVAPALLLGAQHRRRNPAALRLFGPAAQAAVGLVLALALPLRSTAQATAAAPALLPVRQQVAESLSSEARAAMERFGAPRPPVALPAPNDLAAWNALRQAPENFPPRVAELFARLSQGVIEKYQPTLTEGVLGGVPVLAVKPRNWKASRTVLVVVHGGAYVFGSPRSTLPSAAPLAGATGLRVICVGYTLAPEAKWDRITDQVVAVLQALVKEGHAMKDIAIFGESAGGGLAAGAVLKMRDQGLGMPAAIVLWSPWADITETGDSYLTLKDADPILNYACGLKNAANAYADPEDQKNPYVSPVYGDYSKGFPPTLIQGGTREIFLSNVVRQYQAIASAGGIAVLDLYEGMPHVHQVLIPDSPEAAQALARTAAFLAHHLGIQQTGTAAEHLEWHSPQEQQPGRHLNRRSD